jgi:hypothetical protein
MPSRNHNKVHGKHRGRSNFRPFTVTLYINTYTITNTRLRVEEIVDERKGDFTAYLRPEDPTCRSMYGYMADHGRYPFPVKFVEEELEKENGSFKRG